MLWRNPEIKKWASVYGLFTLGTTGFSGILCFLLVGKWKWILPVYVLLVCLGGAAVHLLFTKKRYDDLATLADQLNHLLHSTATLQFIPDQEGELALLTSEIQKLTIRLVEQAEIVGKEKENLKNSLADISHQIRTPLTSVRMLVQRMLRQEELSQRQKYAQTIYRLLTRMEWQISVLLKIARLESGTVEMQKKTVEVINIIQKAWEPIEIMAEIKDISLEKPVEIENLSLRGDEGWLTEAIENILKNCVEHLPDGGKIWIDGKENPIYTEIRIGDNGNGIAPEDLPHIFERFYQGENRQKENAGIGLALAQMIIHRQNGTIQAGRSKWGGAEFCLRFYVGT